MSFTQRPYPLVDEIKMHLVTWVADDDWKKMPVPLKEALNMALTEIKVAEDLKKCGVEDERGSSKSDPVQEEKKRFYATFVSQFLEFAGFKYSGTYDATTKFIMGNAVSRLMSEGATSVEYVTWFFKEFMEDEFNKKRYAPPTLKIILRNDIIDKYIYLHKSDLKIKKQDVANFKVKNAIMTIAKEYLQKSLSLPFSKEFGQKVLDYSRGVISLKKFSTLFLNLLHTQGEDELHKEVSSIVASLISGDENGQV